MRRLLAGLTLLGLAWLGSFIWFVASLPGNAPFRPSDVQGIVVLTGAGGDRLPSAMALMHEGIGQRLLISGVNPNVSSDDIAALWPGDRTGFDCCVDLGKRAETTEGNAQEVAAWARAHSFNSIVLVTSDYHLPRAMLEMRAATPKSTFIAYPVASVFLDTEGRPVSVEAWRALVVEYMKYLAVRLKTILPI